MRGLTKAVRFVLLLAKDRSFYLPVAELFHGQLLRGRGRHFALAVIFSLWSGSSLLAQETVHDIALPSSGVEISLGDYKGKLLYIDFWASWCAPCLQSFPWMNEMQTRYADQGLQIVAINLDLEKALTDDFLAKTKPLFPIGYDPQGVISRQFNVVGMPNSFLFDGEGNLVSSHVGWRLKDVEKYEASLVAALAALKDQ